MTAMMELIAMVEEISLTSAEKSRQSKLMDDVARMDDELTSAEYLGVAIVRGMEKGQALSRSRWIKVMMNKHPALKLSIADGLLKSNFEAHSPKQLMKVLFLLECCKINLLSTNTTQWCALSRVQLLLLNQMSNNKKEFRELEAVQLCMSSENVLLATETIFKMLEKEAFSVIEKKLHFGFNVVAGLMEKSEPTEGLKSFVTQVAIKVIESRNAVSKGLVQSLKQVLPWIDQKEFHTNLVPKIESCLKLKAETKIEDIGMLFLGLTQIRLDASNLFFMDPLLKGLLSSSESLRASAVRFVQAVGPLCSTVDTCLALLKVFGSALKGEGVVGKQVSSQPNQRGYLIDAINAFAICAEKTCVLANGTEIAKTNVILSDDEINEVGAYVVDLLLKQAREESNQVVKGEAVVAASHWIVVSQLESGVDVQSMVDGILVPGAVSGQYVRSVFHVVMHSPLKKMVIEAMLKSAALKVSHGSFLSEAIGVPKVAVKATDKKKVTVVKKSKKGGADDALAAEMLSLGSKKKKLSDTPVNNSAAGGCVRILLDTVATGESIATNKTLFGEHCMLISQAYGLLYVLSLADKSFEALVGAGFVNDALNSKKVWSSLWSRLSRVGNVDVEPKKNGYIAGINDEDAYLTIGTRPALASDVWSRKIVGRSSEEETQLSVIAALMDSDEGEVLAVCAVSWSLSSSVDVRIQGAKAISLLISKGQAAEVLSAATTYLAKNAFVDGMRLRDMLLSTSSSDLSLLPKLVLLAHHPAAPKRMWLDIVKKFPDSEKVTEYLMGENSELQSLLVDDLCFSQGPLNIAASRAVAYLISLGGSVSRVPGLKQALAAALDFDVLNAVTAEDAKICRTSPGELSESARKELEHAALKNSKKETSASKGNSSVEDEWERQVRAEIEAKKNKDQPGESAIDEKLVARKLEEEERIRAVVLPLLNKAQLGLQVLETFCKMFPVSARGCLVELSHFCFSLVKSPLLERELPRTFEAFLGCIPNSGVRNSQLFLASVLILALRHESNDKNMGLIGQACRILHGDVCRLDGDQHVSLEHSDMFLLFPILKEMVHGTVRDLGILTRWAAHNAGQELDEDEDDDDDDDDEQEKKKEKKKPKKEKKKEKKPKTGGLVIISQQTPPVLPKSETLKAVVFEYDGESPGESIERVLGLLHYHASMMSHDVEVRRSSIEMSCMACSIVPEASPKPGEVLVELCAGTPALVDAANYEILTGDSGVLSSTISARLAVMNAITAASKRGDPWTNNSSLVSSICLVESDEDPQVKSLATELRASFSLAFPPEFSKLIWKLLFHEDRRIRIQTSQAIAGAIGETPSSAELVVGMLKNMYETELSQATNKEPMSDKPKFIDRDAEGKELRRLEEHSWPRESVALTMNASCATSDILQPKQVLECFAFICGIGLKDPTSIVRQEFLLAGVQLIKTFGKQMIDDFLPNLESSISKKSSKKTSSDWQREGAVVMLGTLASYLAKDDTRIPRIVDSLLEALRTPNDAVQLAATKCIPPLMKNDLMKQAGPKMLDQLVDRVTMMYLNDQGVVVESDTITSHSERRGAAFGVASLAKGLGITVLKKNNVVSRIEAACKANTPECREGGLFALEALSTSLGMLFEPYIITVLGCMLQCFADSKKTVRIAAQEASRAIMANLSGHGVKLVMPSLLSAIDDPAWRTKQAAIRMLGSMAYCAKKQLSACLPMVVPVLVICFTDTHAKVRVAASKAMDDLASVIQNPEVQALVPTLKSALKNPHEKTAKCVDILHRTRFVHTVDAPSLALLVPVLDRGLVERSTETKKKAALIVGNMCSMISDPKSVLPYLKDLMPVLRKVLTDPIPGVRATAAKAFGTLTRGLGENLPDFQGMLQWLLETSRGNTSPVERSGGAQGLVEVAVALGEDFVVKLLNENVYPVSGNPSACVREGVVWVFVFLPTALGVIGNASFVDKEFQIVIRGLADDNEMVRDSALRAGQVIVEQHAVPHTNKLLPVLEEGLSDAKWRIRQSSVHLLGDLLRRVGSAGDEVAASRTEASRIAQVEDEDDAIEMDSDDEETQVKEDFDSILTQAIGHDRRLSVFASLYMMRSDNSAVVRQSAMQVWKILVNNTGRTLREVLNPLMALIIAGLSSLNEDSRTVAGRCLGDIVRKLGDRVLPDIIPVLMDGLGSSSVDQRVGVAVGLCETIRAASKRQVEVHLSSLLPAVEKGLSDTEPTVQDASAEAFGLLYKQAGVRTVNEIVPNLMAALEKDGAQAMEGLRKVLSVRSREIMPLLLPRLMVSPMTPFHADALASVCETISPVLHYYVEKIQAFLIMELVKTGGGPGGEHEKECEHVWRVGVSMVSSVEQDNIHWLIPGLVQVLSESKSGDAKRVAVSLLAEYCEHTETDFSMFITMMLKDIIKRFAETENKALLLQSLNAFARLSAAATTEEMTKHMDFIRQSIKSVASDARWSSKDGSDPKKYLLPVFGLPKSLDPFLPVFQHALMNAAPAQRESAATGLGELVDLTSEPCLKPYIVKLTGPLIRIAGDRFPWEVKLAILRTIFKLQMKGGMMLRPFLPQLQTTFVKALAGESPDVRRCAAVNLCKLVKISTRVDPLVNDLIGLSRNEDPGTKGAAFYSLSGVLGEIGAKVSQPVLDQCVGLCRVPDEANAKHMALALAYATKHQETCSVSVAEFAKEVNVFNVTVCTAMLWETQVPIDAQDALKKFFVSAAASPNELVRAACAGGYAGLLGTLPAEGLAKFLTDKKSIVRKSALEYLKRVIKSRKDVFEATMAVLVPAVIPMVKDSKSIVSAAAERVVLHMVDFNVDIEHLKMFCVQSKLTAPVTRSFIEYCTNADQRAFDSDEDSFKKY